MFGFFKKQASAQLPSPDAEPDRYAGRPLLIILENYVLDCLGELPPTKQANLRSIVQRVWGGGEDWKSTVRQQLHLESSLDQSLRDMWARNLEIAQQNHVSLEAVSFAKMVVDKNFVHLIGESA